MNDRRTEELAANLADVEERLVRACAAAGRPRDEVTLVVVTKTWPADDVRRLASLGVRDVGENRDQEAAPKARECADLDLRWHFVGQLQTNKAKSVARYAAVVHSVDRPALVTALDAAALAAGRELSVLLQVSLEAGGLGRGGVAPSDVEQLADLVSGSRALTLGGVMAVAPVGAPPAAAFERLAEIAALLRTGHPDATVVSAGMSADLEEAVAAGATHVRVGTAVLGGRPPLG